jgi:Na+-translocating ferredoxin:NAD+ oxidoreductase RnfD subunit
VASVLLLITNASQTTWGFEVATTQFYPPQMYLAIFLFAIPGQYLFGVTHLLFTDPATSPRTELGRIVYGVLYGLTTVLLYGVLIRAGMPGFYDKLLQVPLLNLSAGLLVRLARSPLLEKTISRRGACWSRAGVTSRTSACGRLPSP